MYVKLDEHRRAAEGSAEPCERYNPRQILGRQGQTPTVCICCHHLLRKSLSDHLLLLRTEEGSTKTKSEKMDHQASTNSNSISKYSLYLWSGRLFVLRSCIAGHRGAAPARRYGPSDAGARPDTRATRGERDTKRSSISQGGHSDKGLPSLCMVRTRVIVLAVQKSIIVYHIIRVLAPEARSAFLGLTCGNTQNDGLSYLSCHDA